MEKKKKKKKGPVRTTIGSHGSENRDQTASHGSLLPLNLNLKKKKKKQQQQQHRKTSFKF